MGKNKFKKKLTRSERGYVTDEEANYRESFDFTCHFDGSFSFSKVGYGFCVIENTTRQVIKNFSNTIYMPKGSSNVAEYKAFHSLLNYLDSTVEGANILIIGDSMLVVNQMNGTQGIRKGAYKPFALSAREQLGISQTKNKFTIKWVYREQNSIADDLSKCS